MAVTETIQELLQGIDDAQYGRDMRQFIHKGIQKCYEEGSAGETDLVARERLDEVEASISDLGMLYEMPYDTTVTATQNSLHLYVIPTIKIAIVNGMIKFDAVPETQAANKPYLYNLPLPPRALWYPYYSFIGSDVHFGSVVTDIPAGYSENNAGVFKADGTLDTSSYYRFCMIYPYTALSNKYPLSAGTLII